MLLNCCFDVPISQKREPVLVAIFVVVVLPSRVFDRFKEVDRSDESCISTRKPLK